MPRESLPVPAPALNRDSSSRSVENVPLKETLDATEKQDIDGALSVLEGAPIDVADHGAYIARVNAEGVILSYGARAKTYLEAKLKEGRIREGDYSFFESYWWDNAYNDDLYGIDDDESDVDMDGSFEEELLSQREKVYEGLTSLMQELKERRVIPASFDAPHEPAETPKHYSFFKWPESRKELFQFCKAIADYLRKEHVPNLVIIDRSSRPLYVGVREYWKSQYPGEKMPNFYFMNPKGFKAREDLTPEEVAQIIDDCEWKEDASEFSNRIRSKKQILDEIEETYTELVKDKDKPLLIFDTCLHSGRTLEPVCAILKEKGFEDVRVGSVNPSDTASRVKTDFFITRRHAEMGCYPFDRDRLVEKTFDHVYSRRTDNVLKRRMARLLRDEIQRIVREQINEQNPFERV